MISHAKPSESELHTPGNVLIHTALIVIILMVSTYSALFLTNLLLCLTLGVGYYFSALRCRGKTAQLTFWVAVFGFFLLYIMGESKINGYMFTSSTESRGNHRYYTRDFILNIGSPTPRFTELPLRLDADTAAMASADETTYPDGLVNDIPRLKKKLAPTPTYYIQDVDLFLWHTALTGLVKVNTVIFKLYYPGGTLKEGLAGLRYISPGEWNRIRNTHRSAN